MSVITCSLTRGGREFEAGDDGNRSHTDRYLIVCDRDDHPPIVAGRLATRVGPHPLPQLWQFHAADDAARCKKMQISQSQEDPAVFFATVNFDTVYNPQVDQGQTSPILRPTAYRAELQQFQKPVVKTIDGKPIENSCNRPFDPPLMDDDSRQVLVAVRNIETLGEVVALQRLYKDAVNINRFYGAGPRQAKVISITCGEQQVEQGVSFYPVTFRIGFKEDGETWVREVLNQGFGRFAKPNDPSTYTTKDVNGVQITTPIKLRKDGTQLLDRDLESQGGSDQVVFLKFKTYPERDFRGLGI